MDTSAARHLTLVPEDPRFPPQLRHIPGPPRELHVEGRAELLHAPCVAIVGSRNCTPHGAFDAHAFALAFSQAGFCVVSGLALGVDAAAHRGALEGGSGSIAVLGTGIDRNYPRSNQSLALALRRDGCVVSEFPPGVPPLRENFPRRNRLISGLALGVLVIEATEKSGSLITARHAADQGRDVFAIPGSIHSTFSKGCHRLIRDGAKLVETAQEVLADLGWKGAAHGSPPVEQAWEMWDGVVSEVLNALGQAPMSMDQVANATGWPIFRIAAELTRLELARHVTALPGGRYQRAPGPAASRVIE